MSHSGDLMSVLRTLASERAVTNLTAPAQLGTETRRLLKMTDADYAASIEGWVVEPADSLSRGVISVQDRKRANLARRYRVKVYDELGWLPYHWAAAFSLWLQLFDAETRRLQVGVINCLAGMQLRTDAELSRRCKQLSEHCLKWGEFSIFGARWQKFAHIHLFGGYHTEVEDAALKAELGDWVSTGVVHTHPTSDYDTEFKRQLGWLHLMPLGADRVPGFDTWLSLRGWARSGSTFVDYKGPAAKNKHVLAWTRDDSQLRSIIERLRTGPDDMRVILKAELGKVRPVIAVGDAMYLAMSYVADIVEPHLAASPIYNYMSGDGQLDAKRWLTKPGIHVPLDESNFDHNKSANSVIDAVKAIGALARRVRPRDAFLSRLTDWISASLYGGTLEYGGAEFKAVKGVLSGWRWTYLLDSVINVTQVKLTLVTLRQLGYRVDAQYVCSGDDVAMKFANTRDASLFVATHSSFGYNINPAKFWLSSQRNEFLRLVYFNESFGGQPMVQGYATRMLPKLLSEGPLNADEEVGAIRAAAVATNWELLVSRGAERDLVDVHQANDLAGLLGANASLIRAWLHTPAAFGGFGRYPAVPPREYVEIRTEEGGKPDLSGEVKRAAVVQTARAIEAVVGKQVPNLRKAVLKFASNSLLPKRRVFPRAVLVHRPRVYMPGYLDLTAIVKRPRLEWVLRPYLKELFSMSDFDAVGLVVTEGWHEFVRSTAKWSRQSQLDLLLGEMPSAAVFGLHRFQAAQAAATELQYDMLFRSRVMTRSRSQELAATAAFATYSAGMQPDWWLYE